MKMQSDSDSHSTLKRKEHTMRVEWKEMSIHISKTGDMEITIVKESGDKMTFHKDVNRKQADRMLSTYVEKQFLSVI